MLRRFTLRLSATAMAGLLILGLSERAHADLEVTLDTVSTGVLSGNGQFPFNLTSGTFQASGTATGESVLGPATMDLSSLSVSGTAGTTVNLILSMDNINSPVGPGTISETITGHFVSGTGSASYTTYGSNANTLFTSVPTLFDGSAGPAALGGTATGSFNASAPYSLTEVVTITFTTTGTLNASLSSDSSANFSASAVPEPSTMAIAGLGALGMIGYGLRRRKSA